jgi:protein TonB
MMMALPSALAVAAPAPAPAVERRWPVVAGWRTDAYSDGCALTRLYGVPGAAETLHLALRIDGGAYLSVVRPGWTTSRGRDYHIRYEINGAAIPARRVSGTYHDGRWGYVADFGPDLAPALAAGNALRLSGPEGLLADLSLRGSASAIAIARQCVAAARANLAAGTPQGRGAPLGDPFNPRQPPAPPAPPPPPRPVQGPPLPVPESDVPVDYPPDALRAGLTGTVEVRYTIGPDGRVHDCAVAVSSGHPSLDAATCPLLQQRVRYEPARDARGNPTSASRTQRVRWELPPDQELPAPVYPPRR